MTLEPNLQELAIAYQVAAATERQVRDQNIASWEREIVTSRDYIHEYLQQVGFGNPKELHRAVDKLNEVAEAMDEFLKRSKK